MTSRDVILWGTAALTYGLGGYVMTVLGVGTTDAQEGSPLVRRLSGGGPGPGSFVVLKLVSAALFFVAYWVLKPTTTRLAVPPPLMVLDAVATARNARIIHHRA